MYDLKSKNIRWNIKTWFKWKDINKCQNINCITNENRKNERVTAKIFINMKSRKLYFLSISTKNISPVVKQSPLDTFLTSFLWLHEKHHWNNKQGWMHHRLIKEYGKNTLTFLISQRSKLSIMLRHFMLSQPT